MIKLNKFIKFVITVGIFIFLYYKFDVKFYKLFADIKTWEYIILGIICRLLIVQSIAMNRWQLFLRHSGINENIWTLTKISFVSSFMGVVLPSSQGGDIVRMYWIEKRNAFSKEQKTTASSSVLIERMIGFVILAAIGLINCLLLPSFKEKNSVISLILVINIALWSAIFLLTNQWCYNKISQQLSKISRLKKLCSFFEKTHRSLVTFPYRKILIASVILIGALQITTIIILYCVFQAFGINLPFYYHLAFYPVIAILSIVPISISGLGLREGFFVFFYSSLGVSADMCVKISLINYCTEVLSGVFVGGILYTLIQIKVLKSLTE